LANDILNEMQHEGLNTARLKHPEICGRRALPILAMPVGEAPPDGLKRRAFPHIAQRRVPTGSIRRTTPTNLTTNNDYLKQPAFPLSRNETARRHGHLNNETEPTIIHR